MFAELLRGVPGLVSTPGEINPHVIIGALEDFGADVVADPSPLAGHRPGLEVMRTELGLDLGRPADGAVSADRVAWRLTMQWPCEAIEPEAVQRWVWHARRDVGDASRMATFLAVLAHARRRHPTINPKAYDVDGGAVAREFRTLSPPAPPPPVPVIEMAPYVVPRAWRPATDTELTDAPVVLVTPRNAFRLPLLQAAFPNAEIRVVHLVRNPAAAVNGLIDGWHHWGFFSTPVDVPLSISGYTDRHPAWGGRWWCFDVPPGWRAWASATLTQVCGFQWAAAHRVTLEAVETLALACHRIRFEDLVGPPAVRGRALGLLARWIGVDPESFAAVGRQPVPVVMPTRPPRPGRWRNRSAELSPLLEDPAVRSLAEELGYGADPAAWW